MIERISRLKELMTGEGIDAFLVTIPENRYYFTGFTGSSGAVLITDKEIFLITDFRYEEQAKIQSPHCEVVLMKDNLPDTLTEVIGDQGIKVLGCEGDYLTYQQLNTLKVSFADRSIKPLESFADCLRVVKDTFEIEVITRAVRLADRSFDHIMPFIKEGISEKDLALEMEFFMRKNGAEGVSFPLIVASGHRSSLPHGTASGKKLARGDLVTMDFGACLEGYNSDITRTVVVGETDPQKEKIYSIVLEAQLAGIKAVKPGMPASVADRAARDVIEKYGYGEYFGHSTGHGLGLKVHESPRLSSKDCTELKPGMVVTVEPGIYLPGWGGVRIEDTVLVEDQECRVLSGSPKHSLIICG